MHSDADGFLYLAVGAMIVFMAILLWACLTDRGPPPTDTRSPMR
ncbi:hypothetical protein [Sphingomonas sp. CARO-RG-8B-R24-01]|nr:hypothetical protein [Sphingomonas sp. CARO-RG-8B-R24-01]